MKMYCISDNLETAIGLRLTGMEVTVVKEEQDAEAQIGKVLADETIGILVITEKVYEWSKEKVDKIRENAKVPLVVKI